MLGPDIEDEKQKGIIPRVSQSIFDAIRYQFSDEKSEECEFQIRIQMLEIYKEQLIDLLSTDSEINESLKVKECATKGTYVDGLTTENIVSEDELMKVLKIGSNNRHVG